MANLESVVLPLEQSRALAEKGIVLDTAMVWVHTGQGWWNGGGWNMDKDGVHEIPLVPTGGYADEVRVKSAVDSLCTVLCPAPALSELLDAIRAKVGSKFVRETVVMLGRDGSEAGATCAGIRTDDGGGYRIAPPAPTDLLAAASLLLEVTK